MRRRKNKAELQRKETSVFQKIDSWRQQKHDPLSQQEYALKKKKKKKKNLICPGLKLSNGDSGFVSAAGYKFTIKETSL